VYKSRSSSLCSLFHTSINSTVFDPKYSPQRPILEYS
jgi:hypothetical protein